MRRTGFGAVAVLTTVVVMLAGGLALADEVIADGDGVAPFSASTLAMGNVCANTTVSKDVLVGIENSGGGGNSFKEGSAVTVSATTPEGTGLAVAFPSPQPSGSSNPIVMPSNWNAGNAPAASSPATARVTLVTGAPRTLTGSVTFQATGLKAASNNTNTTRTVAMPVTATVVACDATAPTLNLPADQTVEATGPDGRVVTFTATASDTAPASPAVTCTPASGSTFPVGTTTVSCSATDSAGNTATGAFAVTVVDGTGPSFGPLTDVTVEASGPTGAPVSYTAPTATDLVDGARPVSCTPTSGSTFAVGSTTVSCSASDTSGNTTVATVSISVADRTGPTLLLPVTVIAEATSADGAVVAYADQVSATDVVDGAVTPDCTPSSGSEFALGATTVSCTATDDAGNPSTGTFTVEVVDTTAPAITVPDPFTTEATGPAGRTVTYAASASDLVDGAIEPTCALASGATFPIGSTTVTCTATDREGNSSSRDFTVTVVDTTAPSISLSEDVIAEADTLGGKAVTYSATAQDLVDGAVAVTCSPASGSLFPVGVTEVLCSATDLAGNLATLSLSVTVTDTTGPVVAVPADLTLEATGPDGATADFEGDVSAADTVDGSLETTCIPASGATLPLGATEVTCSATDAAGNTGSDSFTVTVEDTTEPVIDGTPDDLTVEATGPDGAVVTYSSPTATDLVSGTVAVSCVPTSGSTFPLGQTTIVTCTATDGAGNPATATFDVLVSDTTAPVLTLPSQVTAEATGPDGATVLFEATATDAVDTDVPVTCVPPSGTTFTLGTTSVGCTAEDDTGNEATGSFAVTVADTTAPELTVPADITAEATSAQGATVSYTTSATDVVDGLVEASCTPASGSTFSLGVTTVECSATDAAGNKAEDMFTVTVEDTIAPLLALPADITAEATSAQGATVGYTATAEDVVDGAVNVSCDPAAGAFPLGSTTVSCSATDQAGNTATGSFTVTVRDTTAPVVTVPADITAEATSAAGAAVTFLSSATDAVDGAGTPTCTPSSGSVFALGSTPVTCTITDAAGNTGTAGFTVEVQDTTGPTIGSPQDLVQEATGPAGATVTYTNPTAVDLVDGAVAVTCAPPSSSIFALGETTVSCTATDARGNGGSSQFVVTVTDTSAPVLTLPASFTAEATGPAGASVPFSTSATDVVDGSVAVTCTPASGDTFPLGSTTVACGAGDSRGNSAAGSFSITVVDTTEPTLTVPADMTLEATGPAGATASFAASAVDLVDGALVPVCTPASGATFPVATTTVTCTATDEAGNTATRSFTVTVQDTIAPTLSLPSAITRTAAGASGAPVSFTATSSDVVDGAVPVTCAPPSGTTFAPGTTTVRCNAEDASGNPANGEFTVSVLFDISGGLLQPVNPGALNTVKGGSTVPLKFQVRDASGGYITALSVVTGFLLTPVQCGTLVATQDPVDFTTTGGTVLRYDTASNQFHQNWQTPKKPGACYRVDVVLTGGQRLSASFQLK